MDLCAALSEGEDVVLKPGRRTLIPTGIAVELPHGYEGQVRPRSGLALNDGLTILNSPGTIDSDYRGELGVILINLGQNDVVVRRGLRIAQFVIKAVETCNISEAPELDETPRGSGGFGSTGR